VRGKWPVPKRPVPQSGGEIQSPIPSNGIGKTDLKTTKKMTGWKKVFQH
jgi:hypothetical protein